MVASFKFIFQCQSTACTELLATEESGPSPGSLPTRPLAPLVITRKRLKDGEGRVLETCASLVNISGLPAHKGLIKDSLEKPDECGAQELPWTRQCPPHLERRSQGDVVLAVQPP